MVYCATILHPKIIFAYFARMRPVFRRLMVRSYFKFYFYLFCFLVFFIHNHQSLAAIFPYFSLFVEAAGWKIDLLDFWQIININFFLWHEQRFASLLIYCSGLILNVTPNNFLQKCDALQEKVTYFGKCNFTIERNISGNFKKVEFEVVH